MVMIVKQGRAALCATVFGPAKCSIPTAKGPSVKATFKAGIRFGALGCQPYSAYNALAVRRLVLPITRCQVDDDDRQQAASDDDEGLQLPEIVYTTPLTRAQSKAYRAQAETLARDKQLMKLNIGQKGITRTALSAAADLLCRHEFVRVKLGDGSGMERREAATLLAAHLDASVVHQVGFTITLWRQRGLPRPSNCVLPQDHSTQRTAMQTLAQHERSHKGSSSSSVGSSSEAVEVAA